MTLRRALLSTLVAVGLAACGGDGDSNDLGLTKICTPGDFVNCLCSDGSFGTKQCSEGGLAFGACEDCQGHTACVPGETRECLCGGGAVGLQQCREDGGAFDACHDCLPVEPGGAGGTSGGAGGSPGGAGGGTAGLGGLGGSTGGAGGATGGLGGSTGGVGGATAGAGGTAGVGPITPPNDTCPGTVATVTQGSDTVLKGTTLGAKDGWSTCGVPGGGDVVYQLTPAASGTLLLSLEGKNGLDPVLGVFAGACGVGQPSPCADVGAAGAMEALTIPVTQGKPVYVVVDGHGGAGDFTLTASLAGPVPGDKCPGEPVSLAPGKPVTVTGDTGLAKPDLVGDAPCDKTNSTSDVVYAVTPTASGKVTATLTPKAGFDGVLYARSGACTTGPQITCSQASAAGGVEAVTFDVVAGKTYSVVVDGQSGSQGAYSLALSLAIVTCGDGVVTPDEQCDDGNDQPNDGCFGCKVEQNPPSVDCPGLEVHAFGPPTVVSGSTAPYANVRVGSCGGDKAKDRVYRVVPEATGTLSAELVTASFDAVLYARGGACSGTYTELGCDDVIGNGKEKLLVPVTKGTPVWIVVDGYQTGSGTFSLELSIL